MKFFKQSLLILLAILAISSQSVEAVRFTDNTLKLGNGSSATAKVFEADIGSGTTNPKIKFENSTFQFTNDGVTWVNFITEVLVPTGMVIAYAGSNCPSGWLAADGSAISRSTYDDLFSAIGINFGEGDGSTTFNLPDLRWRFLRGYGPNLTTTGSGSAASNNGTFTAHGFNRTGTKVRLSSGTLSGLSTNTDYWLIVVDANTLAFATSKANALASTKIAITGANSAVIVQNEAPDVASRTVSQAGGNSGANVGSMEEDAFQGHDHTLASLSTGSIIAGNGFGSNNAGNTGIVATDGTSGSPRTSIESRSSNVYVLYCVKE